MEEAAKGALRRPDRAHGTAGKSGRKSARPGSACLHCLSLHGSVAPTYSGVLPTRAAVQCRRSSSAPPPAPPAPSCPLPPAAAPPSPPRPLIPPGLPPPSVCGGEGGALTGGRPGFPALGRAGGRFRRLRYGPAHVRHTWARLPAWLYKPCATLSRRFLLSEERPVRRAPAGRNATPLCARRTTCSAVRHERPTIQRDARPRHPGLCVLHGRQGGCAAGGSLVRRFSALHRPAAAVA